MLERAPFSGGESVIQHLFARLCPPGAEQNEGGEEVWPSVSGAEMLPACCLKSQSSLRSPSSPSRTPNCSSTAWSRLHGCRLEGCISVAIRREHVGDQPHLNQPLVVSAEGLSPQQPCRLMFVHMWLFLITLLQICTRRGIHFHHKLLI